MVFISRALNFKWSLNLYRCRFTQNASLLDYCIYAITYFSPGELKITVGKLRIIKAQHSLKGYFIKST